MTIAEPMPQSNAPTSRKLQINRKKTDQVQHPDDLSD